jgi:hypothetical protein
VIVYEVEIPDDSFTGGHCRYSELWEMVARATGRHVSPEFCRMVVKAKGADTVTLYHLPHRASRRYTFEKAP